jgi:ribonuclease-3
MEAIAYSFQRIDLLRTALTHSSFANEKACAHNERLEFLGDAVLELVVSAELYRRFPEVAEGMLTKLRSRLVSMPHLAEAAKSLELDRYLFLGKGEENQGGRRRDSLLADAFEALLGAVFLDGGFEAAREVVLRLFASRWPLECLPAKAKDYKSQLQELTQHRHKSRPVYRLLTSFGPEHDKRFEVELILPEGKILVVQESSLKKAEQLAARKALEYLTQPA